MNVGRLGERKAIALIRSAYSYGWPNSDCSSIDIGSKYMLITTDSIAESTHIPKGASPEQVGYFFAAINLSDIAAMGGTPKYFMSAFLLPEGMDAKYLLAMQRGIRKCLQRYGAKMIGGDLKKGKELTMTGIAIGEVEKGRKMERLNIRDGDAVCVTGTLGRNAAGFHMWKHGDPSGAGILIGVEPRIREGRFLSANGVKAAMDLSDGIYSAISQLNDATGKGFTVEYNKIPIDPIAAKASKKFGVPLEELCLNFGGEYELIFTAKDSIVDKLIARAGKAGMMITKIGHVTGKDNYLLKKGAKKRISERGYEHFITD